jgi:pyridoxamine 5'-phosphate oxidase
MRRHHRRHSQERGVNCVALDPDQAGSRTRFLIFVAGSKLGLMNATQISPQIADSTGEAFASATTADLIGKFNGWLEEAVRLEIPEPTTMSLATADEVGEPSVRMVQLKRADERGFEFYTNLQSTKATHLKGNPRAALCLYWQPLGRQVRVSGQVEPVSDAEADACFAARPRLLQIGTWASKQSQPMAGAFDLEQACGALAVRYALGAVPRPPFWSGFRVKPDRIEFFRQLSFGRVERMVYIRKHAGWVTQRLYP